MSENKDNNDQNKTFSRGGRKSPRRRLDVNTLMDLERKKAAEDAEKQAQDRRREEARQDENEKPTLNRAALVSEYDARFEELTAALTQEAEKKTRYAALSAESANLGARLEGERAKLTAALAQEKSAQTAAFLNELRDVETALGTVVRDIEDIAGDRENMKGFVQGLSMVGNGFTKIFNAHAPAEAPENNAGTPANDVSAHAYNAELPEKMDFNGTHADQDAVAVNFSLSTLTKKLEKLQDSNKSMDEKIAAAEKQLARAKESYDSDLARARREYEGQKELVLKKIAMDAVGVADNLGMAMKTLAGQKDNLGDSFNQIAARVQKADDEMLDAFRKFGIEKIAVKAGDDFDYNTHSAVNTGPATDTIKADQILEVLSDGYKLNGTSLRDPMVKVAQ